VVSNPTLAGSDRVRFGFVGAFFGFDRVRVGFVPGSAWRVHLRVFNEMPGSLRILYQIVAATLTAEFVEAAEGAAELAVIRGVVAVDGVEDLGAVGEVHPGVGGALAGAGDIVLAHFRVESALFDGPEASLTPAGVGHDVDQGLLGRGGGFEFVVEGGDECLEFVVGFLVEQEGFGVEAVVDGVSGGDGLAFGGFGASGFAAVDAGGFRARKGSHGHILHDEVGAGGGLRLEVIDLTGNIDFQVA